ncbi:type II secretion system protein G [Parelusimicrobium proximum]|uniref:type IV pilin protein n=1 Tax=Parelusimicrobium proximum TaxID=3228953 RepID=UPI003D164B32
MKKGFTLIELLVVVLIIAILAAVALPQYTAAVEKSRATEAMLNAKALYDAENRYYLANDEYATDKNALDVTVNDTGKFTYTLEVESGHAVVKVARTGTAGYYFRYFMFNNTYPAYSGKLMCIATKTKETGNKVCGSLGSNKEDYKYSATTNNAYFIN